MAVADWFGLLLKDGFLKSEDRALDVELVCFQMMTLYFSV